MVNSGPITGIDTSQKIVVDFFKDISLFIVTPSTSDCSFQKIKRNVKGGIIVEYLQKMRAHRLYISYLSLPIVRNSFAPESSELIDVKCLH